MGALDCRKRAGSQLWKEGPGLELSPKPECSDVKAQFSYRPRLELYLGPGTEVRWFQWQREMCSHPHVLVSTLGTTRPHHLKGRLFPSLAIPLHCVTWAEAEMTPGKMRFRCSPYGILMPSMSPVASQAALDFREIGPPLSFCCCCCFSLSSYPFHQ